MKFLSRVVWSEGMHLGPHHFQTQSRYFEDSLWFLSAHLRRNPWGLLALALDAEAIRNGTAVLRYASGIFPDGLAHDAEGHVWIVSVVSNRVLRIDPATGHSELFLDDSDPTDVAAAEAAWRSGHQLPRPLLDAGGKRLLGNASSLAFGGPDLRTLYIGTLFGDRIACLEAPVAGAPPPHWRF